MKGVLRGILALLVLLPAAGLAQTPDTSLSNTAPPSPVGSGARAMGTGGAFIAIADDATAATWNPAGLTQLVLPEAGISYAYENRDIGDDTSYFRSVNYLSAVYPFSVGSVNVVTSLNFQRLYDFTFSDNFATHANKLGMDATYLGPLGGNTLAVEKHNYFDHSFVVGSNEITGEVGAVSPALAVQVTPALSLGFTYNFWKDGIVGPRYESNYQHSRQGTFNQSSEVYLDDSGVRCTCNGGQDCMTVTPPATIDDVSCLSAGEVVPGSLVWGTTIDYNSQYQSIQTISLTGQNFNVGLLWKATPRLNVGAVYRSEFEASIKREQRVSIVKTNYQAGTYSYHYKFDEMMRFPASYGVGAAFRYSDALTIALDVTRIEWDRFVYHYEHGKYNEVSPVNGAPVQYAGIDPTMTYRLGAEYLLIRPGYVVPIRAGFFYDPEPARGTPDDYYGAALGTGLAKGPLVLDITYWYRWGNDVTLYSSYNPANHKVRETRGDITKQMVMLSAVVHMQ